MFFLYEKPQRVAYSRKSMSDLRTRSEMNTSLNLDAMTIDELWQLHEEIGRVLSVRLTSEKRELEKRLAQLRGEKVTNRSGSETDVAKERRKYPRVVAKYQNPNQPMETWSGRGKLPRWLAAELKSGRSIDEFVIAGRT